MPNGKQSRASESARSTAIAEYEDLEEAGMGGNGAAYLADEVGTESETEDDVADHEAVSSTDAPPGDEGVLEGPEFGSEAAPTTLAAGQELEFTDGFDESLLEMDRSSVTETADQAGPAAQPLDAWYAEFADPAVQALVRQNPRLATETAEVVIGADDRVKVNNTTDYPWRAICSLRITAADDSTWIGTGWLAGPRVVMTAGHCVYIHARGGWVKRIEVIPGRNGASRPFGECTSSQFHSVKGWTESKKRSHDYGAIILSSECKYGNRVGFFGFASLGFFSLLGLKVNLSGYPGDKPTGTQWWHARRITLVTPRTLVYNIDTAGGQSGSPVWRLKNGQRHAVGIHTNGSTAGNSATRITDPVFNNIKNWKNMYT
jgi:glutamyl endopeptidase